MLYKLWNPAFPDWRTSRKFGEHGQYGKDGKHPSDELKHSIIDSKHSIQDLENMIPGQLKIGENQRE